MQAVLIAGIWILAATIVVVLAKRTASHSFQCRHCGQKFEISWKRAIITEHSGSDYKLLCPACNVRDWCTQR